ncbi:hypothetical protein CTEN210_05560 [Chaetoceros tenuissimus]|uniref:Dynein light chain roadblock n=1 Tax=Chaetoceros tenuissimus TaxID=426638 RepID=A0AAD3H400_9STRA|nr:hypothetical protein CTEN210_05560 [Chaetoceros tenuissimus]
MATSAVMSEVEETLQRIKSHKGVEGIIIMTQEGSILQSTLTEEQSKQHGALISSLTEKASLMISTLDPDDKLSFLRVRSQKKEIMIAPDNDFLMMVIQNPNVVE